VKSKHGIRNERLAQHLSGLFGYALSLCGNREDARDLVQNCALKSFTARNVPSDARAYRSWLFRILRNLFIDEARSRSAFALCIEGYAESQPDAFRYEEALINSLTLERGMQGLRLEHREVIGLVDMAGFTYTEAAGLIGIPAGTVMSRLSRARKSLLRSIQEDNVRKLPARPKGVRK
jgi:RNA polymerase sigma-70 factor (ECF subfamily)